MFHLSEDANIDEIVSACLRKRNPALRLGERINEGGTSVVYHIAGASSPQTLKVMYTDLRDYDDSASMRKRFYEYFTNEVKIMRELSSPYIMPVLDSFQYIFRAGQIQEVTERALKDNSYRAFVFVIMPECQSLTDYHKKFPMTERDMIRMTIHICRALQQCHSHDVLHRDVKPDNIFVPLDDPSRFILGDFGFCRRMERNIIPRYTAIGTEGFTAPEVLRGDNKQYYSSDLYSLAASIHWLITGSPYYGHYDKELALSKISPAFYRIIYEKSLPKKPRDRYQNAADMLLDLQPLGGSRRSVFRNPWFLKAKREMLTNHYEAAIQIAKEGKSRSSDKQGAMDCERLLAYCLYHEYSQSPAVMRTAAHMLETLASQGDAIARYMRAMMDIRNGKKSHDKEKFKNGFQNLRLSAEEDCVLAQYYYGHLLFGNFHELPAGTYVGANPRKDGFRFVLKAAETGFPPAMEYLWKIRSQMELSPELKRFVESELEHSSSLRDFLADFQPDEQAQDMRKLRIELL